MLQGDNITHTALQDRVLQEISKYPELLEDINDQLVKELAEKMGGGRETIRRLVHGGDTKKNRISPEERQAILKELEKAKRRTLTVKGIASAVGWKINYVFYYIQIEK